MSTLKKFYGRQHDHVNPYNLDVSRIIADGIVADVLPRTSHKQTFEIPDILFSRPLHIFLVSGLYAWVV